MTPSSTIQRSFSASIAALAIALAFACSAEDHARRADRTAVAVLDAGVEQVLGARRETVELPEVAPLEAPPEPETDAAVAEEPEVPPRVLSLVDALELAVAQNRSYLARKEDLFIQALSLFETRHAFSPLVSSTLSYLFADGNGIPEAHSASLFGGVSQILPTGGTLSADAATGYDTSDDPASVPPSTFDSGLSVRLVQPLLRGAGYEPSHEALTQAEHDLVYAIRDFELFREDFSIDVASRYYDLVQQKQSIENVRLNLEDFIFSERQAQALFDVGRTSELDVLRARRSRLNAENDLIEARETYQLALAQFGIFLGLSTEDHIEVREESPLFVPVHYDLESAVRVALANRLDLLTRREQIEDAERSVRLARNGLLPALDLDASLSIPAGPDASYFDQEIEGESLNVGMVFELPVDRVNQRGAYRRAEIRLIQARRGLDEFQDGVVVGIESAFRELTRRELSLEIQRRLIEDQQKNVRIAQLRFERGEIPNRDVVEAQQSLLDARNALISEQVSYEIARLQLLRDLGILFIDDRGMWTE